MRPHHDIRLHQILPHGQPTPLVEILQHATDHPWDPFGRSEEQPGSFGSERIPERVAGIRFARNNLVEITRVVLALLGGLVWVN